MVNKWSCEVFLVDRLRFVKGEIMERALASKSHEKEEQYRCGDGSGTNMTRKFE